MSDSKRSAEEEYFAKMNQENEAKLAAKLAAEKAVADRAALKALHAMRCGKCGGLMAAQEFRGIEIEVCADCGAVLLDPGELEAVAGKDETGVLKQLAGVFKFKARPTP